MDNSPEISPKAVHPQIWVEAYHDFLFKYALSRLRKADLAEEKIQETFLAALQSGKNFRGLASEKTWLVSILKRKIYDHFRRISRDRQYKATCPMEWIGNDAFDRKGMHAAKSSIWFSDPAAVYEQKEFLKIIRYALSELPGRLAQAFILREIIGLSSQEICELMDISVCNLYVMMHRARKHMRDKLKLKWLCETENPMIWKKQSKCRYSGCQKSTSSLERLFYNRRYQSSQFGNLFLKSGPTVADSRARAQGERIMKSNQQPGILLLSALVLAAIMILMGTVLSKVENPDLARIEFFVS